MRFLDSIKNWLMGSGLTTVPVTIGRNEPCHCGSGLKYKRCCLDKDKVNISKSIAACCKTTS